MIREVDLVSYLPPFMKSYKEPVAALDAANAEFQIVWKAVDRVLRNRFISTADEYGISRFEKLLGIYPSEDDTLESRRSRVQNKWFDNIPYTMKMLLKRLTILCNSSDFILSHNFTEGYTLRIHTSLELFGQVEELETIIGYMLPCNIVIETINEIENNTKGEFYVHGGVAFAQDVYITSEEE